MDKKKYKIILVCVILICSIIGGIYAIFKKNSFQNMPLSDISAQEHVKNQLHKKNFRKTEWLPSVSEKYYIFLDEVYNGYPGMGSNLPEVNAGTLALWQFQHGASLANIQDTAVLLLANPSVWEDVYTYTPGATLDWLNVARSLRGRHNAQLIEAFQKVITNVQTINKMRGLNDSIYEWTLYLAEAGVCPDGGAIFSKSERSKKPSSFFGGWNTKDIQTFFQALMQTAMTADSDWSERAILEIQKTQTVMADVPSVQTFQADSYCRPSPDKVIDYNIKDAWSYKREGQFPVIQVWRDPRRFYPTKQYELELKTLTPERMREIGEEADAELCQKIAAGPLPRVDRFPMFLFDPEIRPAVFLAYDKAFLADPPVPGYAESMERYLALREKLHWLNSHSRYAKYQAPLQEEFDKLAPKFADKEKALAEAEAAYIAQYPDRAPVSIVK